MAELIPDEKCPVFMSKNFFSKVKKTTCYHPRLVAPSTTDGASLNGMVDQNNDKATNGWTVNGTPPASF